MSDPDRIVRPRGQGMLGSTEETDSHSEGGLAFSQMTCSQVDLGMLC